VEVDAAAFYEAYRRSGVEYGAVFRGVSALWSGDGEALGLIECAESAPMAARLDAALQCCAAAAGSRGRAALPYAAGGYERYARLPERFYAHVRERGEGRWRVLLADPEGRVLARVEDFSVRAADATGAPEEPAFAPGLLYLPHWRHAPLEQAASRPAGGRALLIGGGDLADELAAAGPVVRALRPGEAPERVYVLGQSLAAGEWFAALQSLAREHGDRELDLFVANPHTPDGAALAGFTASLAREYPRWRVRNLLYDRPRGVAQHLAAEPASANGEWTLIRGGERSHPRLGAPESARSAAERLPRGRGVRDRGRRRRSGLCLQRAPGAALWSARGVAGKAAARCPNRGAAGGARAGRGWSALPPGRHRRRGATAGRGEAEIKARWGAIHGVIHSALVLDDRSVGRMSAETLEAVLRPKAAGSRALVEVFGAEPLDWLCFFSSAQSFSGGAGQGNYTAACAWQDAYAEALGRTSPYPVHVVNWGYWGEVGVVSGTGYRERMARMGVGSIGAAEGIEIVERVLAGGPRQVAAIKLSAPLAREMGLADAAEARIEPPSGVCLRLDTKAVPPLGMPQLYEQVNALARAGARQELLGWDARRIAPAHRRSVGRAEPADSRRRAARKTGANRRSAKKKIASNRRRTGAPRPRG
jgi:hypothetical protein